MKSDTERQDGELAQVPRARLERLEVVYNNARQFLRLLREDGFEPKYGSDLYHKLYDLNGEFSVISEADSLGWSGWGFYKEYDRVYEENEKLKDALYGLREDFERIAKDSYDNAMQDIALIDWPDLD